MMASVPTPPPPPPAALAPANGGAAAADNGSLPSRPPTSQRPPAPAPQRSSRPPKKPEPTLIDTRLRRQTPFMCKLTFKNNLPEIPSDPKLLVAQPQPDKLAAFEITSLETEPKKDLLFPTDLGIPLSVFDLDRYDCPSVAPPMDPADAALLAPPGHKGAQGVKSIRHTNVPWLMRTQYVTAPDGPQAQKTGSAAPAKRSLHDRFAHLPPEQRAVAEIEATFEAAAQPPVHATKPGVTAVEVLPLLPDVEAMGHRYAVLNFDEDPAREVDAFSKLPEAQRRAAVARCVAKSFKFTDPDGGPDAPTEQILALLVPSALAAAAPSVPTAALAEGDYYWAKEYKYSKEDADSNVLLLRFGQQGVTYAPFEVKLRASKRKRINNAALPSKFRLVNRAATEQEQQETEERRAKLLGWQSGPAGDDDDAVLEDA